MGFRFKGNKYKKDRIRSRSYEKIEKKRLGRLSDYEAVGTKGWGRVPEYESNDSEMYSQWYEKYDDNSTQSKKGIRRPFYRKFSKDDDYLQGGKGRDKLRGGKGDDELLGGSGHDRLSGGKGDDELLGGRGHDRLSGGPGDDYLFGGAGHDYLKGGKGDDVLIGGAGKNRLKGGKGADIFDIKSDTEKGSKCIIIDFNPDEGDKISAGDKVSIEMKGDKAIIEADGAITICSLSRYRPRNAPVFRDWFTDPTSTIVDVVEG